MVSKLGVVGLTALLLGGCSQPEPPEGAEAFTRYWIASYNWMLSSGDDSLYLESTAAECGPCHGLSDEVRADAVNGVTVQGGLLSLVSVSAPKDGTGARTDVVITFDQQPISKTMTDGAVTTEPGVHSTRIVVLVTDEKGWMVAGMGSHA